MAVPNEDLFELIHALTPSEKRYFKLFAQRQGDDKHKLYVKLFDMIDAMTGAYDEQIIKKKLRSPKYIKQLPQMKVYLFDLIMKSMRLYRSDKDVANEVFDLIRDELFFTEKGLKELRIKTIHKAKEIAYQYDIMYLLVTLLRRERVYMLKFPDGDPFAHLEKIHKEEAWVFERLNNETLVGEVYYSLFTQHIKDPTLHEEITLPGFAENLKRVQAMPYADQHTFLEKFYWLRVQALLHRINRKYADVYEVTKQLIDLFKVYPQHRMNVMGNYMDALSNFLGAGHAINNYEAYEETLSILESLETSTVKDKLSVDTSVMQYRMLWYMNTNQLHRSIEIMERFQALQKEYAHLLSDTFVLSTQYNLAVMLFFAEEYDLSLNYCKEVIESKGQIKLELQHGGRLLYLLLQLELNNLVYFDSALRSNTRLMKQTGRYNEFEQTFCGFVKKLIQTPHKQRQPVLRNMYDTFQKMKANGKPREFVFIDETLYWSKARLNSIPLNEALALSIDA